MWAAVIETPLGSVPVWVIVGTVGALLAGILVLPLLRPRQKTAREIVDQLGGQDCLAGKVAVVTGGNGGIGLETTKQLVYAGCRVLVGSRSVANGMAAIKAAGIDESKVEVLALELEDLASIAAFAAKVNAQERLDFLVLNAGIMALPTLEYTKHGFEKQIGVNHTGHFYLTTLLLDKIKAQTFPSRIVAVSSIGHTYGKVDPTDLHYKKGRKYRPWTAYGQSKGANILFIRELADRLGGAGSSASKARVTCLSLHPGVITATGLSRNMNLGPWVMDVYGWITGDAKSIEQGAATTVMACLDPALVQHSGAYLCDCKLKKTSEHCRDVSREVRRALWHASVADIAGALKK